MELAGRTLSVDVGRVAAQANGAAFMHYGDTTVLSTATASDAPREGIDFFPLSVEFEEKAYAVGKIPGGFNKREGKASENSVLTARVIDRPMRPLFPKDFRNDVTLNNLVMSVDPECRPELVAMLGSSIATCISDIPFDGPCAMTQVGMIDGEFIINPSQKQWDEGDLQLTVASTSTKVIMIEAGAKEIPEDKMIEAIYKAHDVNQEIPALVAAGEADVMITETMEAAYYVGQDSRLAAPLIYEPFTYGQLGILMPKGSGNLLTFVNAFLAEEEANGRLDELAEDYIYRFIPAEEELILPAA